MTITEALDKVQYVTDDKGNQAVLIDLETWQQFEALLRSAEAFMWTKEDEASEARMSYLPNTQKYWSGWRTRPKPK